MILENRPDIFWSPDDEEEPRMLRAPARCTLLPIPHPYFVDHDGNLWRGLINSVEVVLVLPTPVRVPILGHEFDLQRAVLAAHGRTPPTPLHEPHTKNPRKPLRPADLEWRLPAHA